MRHSPILISTLALLLGSTGWTFGAEPGEVRQWSDASGKFTLEGELISTDKNLIVLESNGDELIALRRDQLSQTDQEFVQKYETSRKTPSEYDVDSKWKLDDGEVIAGRLMGFGRQELNVKRERGKVWVNDRELEEFPNAYRKLLPNVVGAIDKKRIKTISALEEHLANIGAGPYKYTIEGVQIDLKDWGAVTIPLSLLTTNEAKEIAPGFERWKASQDDDVNDDDRYEAESRERLALDSRDRLRQRKRNTRQRQMQMMELSLLSAAAGVTDVWEVEIRSPFRYGYGRTVLVNAQNSLQARQQVARQYANWKIGAIAKRSY